MVLPLSISDLADLYNVSGLVEEAVEIRGELFIQDWKAVE